MTGSDDHYIIISADTHAGGSHAQYREYLDPKYRDDFDAWRDKYKNPFKDLKDTDLRIRNWDTRAPQRTTRRPTASSARSSSPTRCRRSSRASCCSRSRRRPTSTSTASPASGPTTAGWSTSSPSSPSARAGIGQIFLNDVDDAIDDVKWCHENGLRGGVLVGSVPPTVRLDQAALPPRPRSALGGVRGARRAGERAQRHRRARVPAGPGHAARALHRDRRSTRSARSSTSRSAACSSASRTSSSCMTEMGCAWIPPTLTHLDTFMANMRSNKVGEMRFDGETVPPRSATEYFHQNCYVGASQPTPADIEAALGAGRRRPLHVGQRLPARRGHAPLHPRDAAPDDVGPRARRPSSACSPAPRPSSTASTSTSCARSPSRSGRTVAEVAKPLTELPADANQALRRSQEQLVGA